MKLTKNNLVHFRFDLKPKVAYLIEQITAVIIVLLTEDEYSLRLPSLFIGYKCLTIDNLYFSNTFLFSILDSLVLKLPLQEWII